MSSPSKSEPSPDADHDHGGAPHSSDSASPGELATHARIVAAGRRPLSVLAINSGSSSLRFALLEAGESLTPILTGKFERIGLPAAGLSFTDVRANQNDERKIDAPIRDKLIEHKQHITRHGDDMPEVRDWKWSARPGSSPRSSSPAEAQRAGPRGRISHEN